MLMRSAGSQRISIGRFGSDIRLVAEVKAPNEQDLATTIRSFFSKHHWKNCLGDVNEALGGPFSKCCVAIDFTTAPTPSHGPLP
ncbi:unnamed protein product [Rotaria sp. Silwood2]|nr:unnamed protein product [Rotaria sp. Silwood2]CAF2510469.1 unnamed protein product [Rotaria sp. Silwood2]CAF2868718.1 unnamed protein product [Rotaria sp. Silwood2]CAF3402053.1 unnamed protein product [Rotaria sp. Silwood2]CAF4159664.1 unnamed protein product [Rotaria sp. Silwood2]